ncbi:unnamed protein product [Meloidogyne enterolobii]|uniref:Uncharacterized protein n=1 Tax=Meloidogyne enterolobii TaxID=390850 RepID=A0ACB0ZC46_MELEN
MFSQQKFSEVAADSSIPAYCIKTLGSRHVIIGGGGGSAKTGVLNKLELYLLTYENEFNFKSLTTIGSPKKLIARLNCCINTCDFANMNLDCIVLNNQPEKGCYLLAVGQDKFCTLYKTTGFCLGDETNGGGLSLNFNSLFRIETDKRIDGDSYQKCVRLFRPKDIPNQIKMVTAGTDGYVRCWSITANLLENRSSRYSSTDIPNILDNFLPELEIETGKESIEEIDVSDCGKILATVLGQSTILWSLNRNKDDEPRLLTLPTDNGPEEINTKKFKVRSLRFTSLDRSGKHSIFITIHNQRIRSSKEVSCIALWCFNKENLNCKIIKWKKACNEAISCIELSECNKFIGIGTMSGSIGIFDTQTLNQLLFLRSVHSSFVTALSFFSQRTYDAKDLGRIGGGDDRKGHCFLPGICANSRTSIISISVDKRIIVHQLPFPVNGTFTGFLLRLSLFVAFFYFLFWAIFVY